MAKVLPWIDAAGAARLLGVKRETLYAYVSRGLVRTRPAESGRAHLYQRDDLERLRARSQARAGHGATAASALRWGEPVLDSALTSIDERGPSYRGKLALDLVGSHNFEAVAELLWTGRLPKARACFGPASFATPLERLRSVLARDAGPLDALALVLALGATGDAPRSLVRSLASAPALSRRDFERSLCAESVAEAALLAVGGAPSRAGIRALDEALILCADHELNPSSFAARVAASVGASLGKSALAAVATFTGPLHGGACEQIERFVLRLSRPEDAIRAVSGELEAGGSVPGFGHPLYPKGDPRAIPLLDRARELAPSSERVRALFAVVDAMALAEKARPTLDAGLVALGFALDLPPGAASGLFAIGRSAGWIAHALEQREAGFVLRPRARYAPNV